MNEPTCKKHPYAHLDNFLYKPTESRYYCRLCRAEIMRRNYEKNKSKILERSKVYRQKNPEKIKALRKLRDERKKNTPENVLIKLHATVKKRSKSEKVIVTYQQKLHLRCLTKLAALFMEITKVERDYERYRNYQKNCIRIYSTYQK